MPVNPNDLIITSLETIDAFSMTDEYLWTLDELSQAQIQNSEDSEDITGRNGRLLATLKRNKTVTITGTNGVIVGGMLATQTGGEFKTESRTVRVTEYITVNTGEGGNFTVATGNVEYDKLSLVNSGVYVVRTANNDGTVKEFTKAAQVSAGSCVIGADGIQFNPNEIGNGTILEIIYDKTITNASYVDNIADGEHYAKTVKLYINAFAEDKCNNIYKVQFYVPKADFSGSFDIDMGGSQVTHGFEARSLAGGCTALTNKGLLWTFTVFQDEAA